MGKLSVVFGQMLGKVFPGKTVSSFLGIGFLPSWQSHWSSFLALFAIDVTFILTVKGKHLLSIISVPDAVVLIAIIFMRIAIVMFIIQIIGIFVFHAQDPSANSSENIVIHIASGQVLTVALSMPAIASIHAVINRLYWGICKHMLQCPFWFNDFMHLVFFFVIPFVFFNVVEVIKPWPISSLQLSYNNTISITLEGIIYTFYSVALLYLTAFILCNLNMHDTMYLNNLVMQYTYNDILTFIYYLCSVFSE